MRINPLSLVLQILSAVDAITNLQPGDVDPLPSIHVTDGDKHLDLRITISRDAPDAESATVRPSSTT